MNSPTPVEASKQALFMSNYLDTLCLLERLHRLLLDVIKDEFEQLDIFDMNAVQGLLLFNIGENEVSAGELKSHGYYQGSNVSYNLKKLVDIGYMHHQRCRIDRRAVRVGLTQSGRNIRDIIARLFALHAQGLIESNAFEAQLAIENSHILKRIERYWKDQIRYIYRSCGPSNGGRTEYDFAPATQNLVPSFRWMSGIYQWPVLSIDTQGSAGGSASPFCSSSTEILSGERTKAICPSRGGRLITTPFSCKCWHMS